MILCEVFAENSPCLRLYLCLIYIENIAVVFMIYLVFFLRMCRKLYPGKQIDTNLPGFVVNMRLLKRALYVNLSL